MAREKTGSVREVGKRRFQLIVTLSRFTDPATGRTRKKRYYETFHGKKSDAQQRLREILTANDHGKLVRRKDSLTLETWLCRWLEHHCAHLHERTRRDRLRVAYRYLPQEMLSLRLPDLTRDHIGALYGNMVQGRLSVRGRPVSPKHLHAILRAALSDAVRLKLVPDNAAKGLKLPKVPGTFAPSLQVWTPLEVQRFIGHVADAEVERAPNGPLFAILVTCGLRPSEAMALQWKHYDGSTLLVEQALYERPWAENVVWERASGWDLKPTKTKAGKRRVTVTEFTRSALAAHRWNHDLRRAAQGVAATGPDDFIFATATGSPLHLDRVRDVFKRYRDSLGLPKIRLYDLRHTCATVMLAGGVPVKVASARLGHSTIQLTLDTYAHVLPAQEEEASLVFERILAETPRALRLVG